MDKLIAERGTIRNEFSNLSQNDDVTSKLLNNTRNEEEIFSEELKKYSSLQTRLQSSFSEQSSLLTLIQQQNTEFVSKKQSNNQNAQREQVLQQLNTAFKIYTELKNNLREGIQFYTNFQEMLKQFTGKCEDFVFARQTEKQDLLSEIQRQTTGVNSSVDMSSPSNYPPQQQQQPVYHQQQQQQSSSPNMPGTWQPNMKPVYQQPTAPMGYNSPQPNVPFGQPPPMFNPQAPFGPPGFQQQPQYAPQQFPYYYQQQQPPNQQPKR